MAAGARDEGQGAQRRVVVALASGEGVAYGRRLLERLRDTGVEAHLVLSREAAGALGADLPSTQALAGTVYAEENQAARISSGSFLTRGMIIAPCDRLSVAAIVMGLATNLVYRAADVTLKEGRPLVLGVPAPAFGRIPPDIRARAAEVPGLTLLSLPDQVDEAVDALLVQMSLDSSTAA